MDKIMFKHKVFSLSERLFPMVSRLLGNETKAEDAIQDIMIKLWLKRNKIENHPNLTGFVILTARNYCLDLLRKKSINTKDTEDLLENLEASNAFNPLEWDELNSIIKNILKKLPVQQSEAFIMREIDGFEFTEIAAALELKVEHVRVLVSRARKEIRVELEKSYNYGT